MIERITLGVMWQHYKIQRQPITGWKSKLWGLQWEGRGGRSQDQVRTAICERQLMCEVLCPAVTLSTHCGV